DVRDRRTARQRRPRRIAEPGPRQTRFSRTAPTRRPPATHRRGALRRPSRTPALSCSVPGRARRTSRSARRTASVAARRRLPPSMARVKKAPPARSDAAPASTAPPSVLGGPLRWAIALSLLLLGLRLRLAETVGFGDAEALYAAYALHPQPGYLDHPGLIGIVARLLGEGAAPSPLVAHQFTAVTATLLPWLGFAVARACGVPR